MFIIQPSSGECASHASWLVPAQPRHREMCKPACAGSQTVKAATKGITPEFFDTTVCVV